MSYATNKQWAERSGIGLRIVEEDVGTSTQSSGTQSFDLDNGNVISGTYTLYSGTATVVSSNDLTALTETTHYTLDKDSGRVLITPTGTTFLGSNKIFATYWYTETFPDSVITDLLTNADAQVDLITGRYWGSGTTASEYQDGRASSKYPTTDRPYQNDWDQPDFIVLQNWPVQKVDNVFFLDNPISVNKFYNYSGTAAAYTDKTTAVNSSTEAPFTAFNSTPTTNDVIYIGASERFLGMDINLSTNGSGTSTIDWEYWNGTAWTDITETDVDTGVSTLTGSGKVTWTYPYGWATTSVNGSTNYWIRGTLSAGYTTNPSIATITINDAIGQILEPRQYNYKSNGMLNIFGAEVPNGQRNVRIDYTYGMATTPAYITELSVLIAAEQAFLQITGSSYDEATGYQLGSKNLQIGEAWVNVKQVLLELREKQKRILDKIGRRVDVTAL